MSRPGYAYHTPNENETTSLDTDHPLPAPPEASTSQTTIVSSDTPVPFAAAEARVDGLSGLTTSLGSPPISEISPQKSADSELTTQLTKRQLLWLLFKRSAVWVGGGIGTMIAGIGIGQAVILRRIYVCPPGADCPGSFDPSGNAPQLLQSLMQYWLQFGMAMATFGFIKLSAYQSWFIMMRRGNTIENLDLTLGAIKGGYLDAVRLLLKKGNRWLSIFTLAQLAIAFAISLIVGLSISVAKAQKHVTFKYQNLSSFPNSNVSSLNTDGQLKASAKVVGWALTNNTSHGIGKEYQGTLVFPDGRSNYTVNAQPSGYKITGHISCSGFSNYTKKINQTTNATSYDITYRGKIYTALPTFRLATSMTTVGTAVTSYLWVSNTSGMIPNASVTHDGKINIALCNHAISMTEIPLRNGTRPINPNIPQVSGCRSDDRNVCVADSVSNSIVSWWGGQGTAFWGVSCRGGVVGPLNNQAGEKCTLSNKLWTATVTSMLDALVQTSPREGKDSQELLVTVDAKSMKMWWLQGIVPLYVLLLYGAALYYTLSLSKGNSTLKELNLVEVVGAAQTDYIRTLMESGQLKNSTIRYVNGKEAGFFQ